MSSRFSKVPSDAVASGDAATVAALVSMLSGMGIERSRIDAIINKASRPSTFGRQPLKAGHTTAGHGQRSHDS